jgi:hypothetical protein
MSSSRAPEVIRNGKKIVKQWPILNGSARINLITGSTFVYHIFSHIQVADGEVYKSEYHIGVRL